MHRRNNTAARFVTADDGSAFACNTIRNRERSLPRHNVVQFVFLRLHEGGCPPARMTSGHLRSALPALASGIHRPDSYHVGSERDTSVSQAGIMHIRIPSGS